jgi:hypothetical protein
MVIMNWEGFGRKRSWRNQDISWHLPGRTEENHENPQVNRGADPDSNGGPSEYKFWALPLHYPSYILTFLNISALRSLRIT